MTNPPQDPGPPDPDSLDPGPWDPDPRLPPPAPARPGARARGAAVAVLVLLAPLAAWFALGGELPDRWTEDRALDGACDGLLPARETRDALGAGELAEKREEIRDEGGLGDPERSLYVRCVITRIARGGGEHPAREGSIEVAVHGVPTLEADRDRRDGSLYGDADADRPVPLGHGWTGFFDGYGREDTAWARVSAAVLLDCRDGPDGPDGPEGPEGRSDLLITVDGDVEGTAVDNPADRVRLVRIATATARRAAERHGCDAPLGRVPDTVPLPVGEDEDVEPSAAVGTCAGVPAFEGARVWESPRGATPREHCEVGDGDRAEAYELDAYYGPYAEDMRLRMSTGTEYDGAYTTSAVCPAGDEPALYVVRMRRGPEKSQAYQRAVLKAFAGRSARERGCTVPNRPAVYRATAGPAVPSPPPVPSGEGDRPGPSVPDGIDLTGLTGFTGLTGLAPGPAGTGRRAEREELVPPVEDEAPDGPPPDHRRPLAPYGPGPFRR
ncbi:hypothetical protein ACFYT4_19230 [Streptomyces sp. NPDC004609]|uniref:hypothetical protein n=1 Tax=Streptomyces sp. NPDC004609 TaxID=3364704 RepID=UPI003680EADE